MFSCSIYPNSLQVFPILIIPETKPYFWYIRNCYLLVEINGPIFNDAHNFQIRQEII